jgi:hypothetical protein
MGFLLGVLPAPVLQQSFDAAWELQTSWQGDEGTAALGGSGWRFRYAAPAWDRGRELWVEAAADRAVHDSFVYVSGWCYRSGGRSDRLTEDDHRDVLMRYRDGQAPLTDEHFGNFIAVVHDHVNKRIAIVPDRSALSAVYFARSASGIVISDRAVLVASLTGAALDGQSLVALMRGIHFPLGRSLFANVSRVMCGCYLDLDLAKHTLEVRRWIPLYSRTLSLSFPDCSEVSSAALRRVAERITTPGQSVIDLTGGNDTRLLAAAVDSIHPQGLPDSVSWRVAGSEDAADVRIARCIAELCGWSLKRLERYPPADSTSEQLGQLALLADGAFTVDAAFGRVEQESRHSTASDCLVGAIGGELLRGFFWRHEMLALGRTREVNYQALLTYRLYDTNGVDPRRLGPDAPSQAEHDEIILDGYRRLGAAGGERLNPYKLDVMYLHKLCYSAGNSQSWLSSLRRIRLPLLASEVCATALTFPWRYRMNRRLVLRLIAQLSPRLSSIPNDKQEPMVTLGWASWSLYAAAGLRVATKTSNRMIRSYLGRPAGGTLRSKAQMPPASWCAALRDGQYLKSAVDPSLIRGILADVASPQVTPDALRTFYTLLTAELLLAGVRGLSPRFEFSSTPSPLIP